MAIDDCSSLFATIRRFLPLFATIRTIRDYSHYSGLFAVRYSRLFAIRYSGFPDTLSQFIDFHINRLVASLDSHIKDTTDFLNKLANLATLPKNAILVTLHVSSLCTNILHNEGIDACRRFLDTRTDKQIPTETLCDLLRIIITMNNFIFNQHHYLQIHGTAMGT